MAGTKKPPELQKYTVTFHCSGIDDVTVLHDEAPPQIMGGQGGWQVTSRERRLGLTQWRGNDPIRVAIPVLFDHAISGITDQKTAMRNLMLMGRPPTTNSGQPPVVKIDTNAWNAWPTAKGHNQEWVIENLAWGTNVRAGADPLRQDCVVNLIEYIDEDRVAFANIPNPPQGTGWPKHYVVKKGDTLPKIAVKFYHKANKWHKIANANHIRDPKALKVGKKLVIPHP